MCSNTVAEWDERRARSCRNRRRVTDSISRCVCVLTLPQENRRARRKTTRFTGAKRVSGQISENFSVLVPVVTKKRFFRFIARLNGYRDIIIVGGLSLTET